MYHYWLLLDDSDWPRLAADIGVSPTPMPQSVCWEIHHRESHRIVHLPRLYNALEALHGACLARMMLQSDASQDQYWRLAGGVS